MCVERFGVVSGSVVCSVVCMRKVFILQHLDFVVTQCTLTLLSPPHVP